MLLAAMLELPPQVAVVLLLDHGRPLLLPATQEVVGKTGAGMGGGRKGAGCGRNEGVSGWEVE